MTTWTIFLPDQKCERVDATGINIAPDGALILMDGLPQSPAPKAIYNARHWIKCEPSAIQSGKMN